MADLQLDCGADAERGFELEIRRNCSIAPGIMLAFLASTVCVSFAFGVAFAYFGLWMVLPFVGLEVIALAIAFCVHARHATDRERIDLREGEFAIEIRDGERVERYAFDAPWVRVLLEDAGRDVKVLVGARGRHVEVGRHLDGAGRRRLAEELKLRLQRYRAAA